MLNLLRTILYRLPLTIKMVLLVVIVGLSVWGLMDRFVSRAVDTMFEKQLSEVLKQQSQENRLHFDHHLQAHHVVAKLVVAQKSFTDYLAEKNWFKDKDVPVKYYSRNPGWFLSSSVMRSLAIPRYAILFDADNRAREVYRRHKDPIPTSLLTPSELLIQRSRNQVHLTKINDFPYLVTSKSIDSSRGINITLMLVSPIDDRFLLASLGDNPDRIVGLLSSDKEKILTSNKPELLPAGTLMNSISDRYVDTAKYLQDYGSAELPIRFTTFISRERIKMMTETLIVKGRIYLAVTATIFILSLALVMLWITKRIGRLTERVEDFSRTALGGYSDSKGTGDKLSILEDRFQRLTEDVVASHNIIRREAEEKALRDTRTKQKEKLFLLLRSVMDSLGIGILIADGEALYAANTTMTDYIQACGTSSVFTIQTGCDEERLIKDVDGNKHVFRITGPEISTGEQVILVEDITKQIKLESQLRQAQKMESVGQLAGGIAHDFNNILSVINGYSELALKDMEEDSPFREYISTIHSAGEKAASFTKELLAFSRKQPLEMKPSNINTTIDNIENILISLIGENIRLTIIRNKDLRNVLADKTQLEQVLMNLVINARDALPTGGDVIIKTRNVYFKKEFYIGNEHVKPGRYTMLSVRDTGEGMSENVRESIFEPFFSTKEVGKGTGMGLSTVHGVVKQHSGYITVYSKIGEGTVFKVYIPVTDKELEAETTIKTNDLTGNETILVVDDEPLLRSLVVEMLDPLGYRILVASNGEEAMEVCNSFNGRIDLLLTDVIMPVMNGKNLADKFVLKRPETKVIYMSGYTDDAIVHHGVLEDDVVLINKPLKSSVIVNKMREVLDAGPNKVHNEAAETLPEIHILLADDNADMRNLIQVYLKDGECTVDTAENGEIAVEKFKAGRYDIILMDMQMPVMDGITATKKIRKWEAENGSVQTKIVALTGNAATEDIDKCMHAGCSSHLAKPVKKDTLVHELALQMSVRKSDVYSNEGIMQEKEEMFVAHVDMDLKDLIPDYLEERLKDMNRIQEAVKAQDYETVKILGHTLKGSGGGYGFDSITEIGIHIESAAEEANENEIEKWNNKLSDYLDSVEIIYD